MAGQGGDPCLRSHTEDARAARLLSSLFARITEIGQTENYENNGQWIIDNAGVMPPLE